MSRQETSKQDVPKMKIVVGGVKALMVSQLSTRLLSFSLNLIVARMLTPEEFGLVAVKFHLFNTTILLLSREGLRRGCLVSSGASTEAAAGVLPTAVLVIPVGLAITLIVSASCWLLGEQAAGSQSLIAIQGAAACAELLGEPLYILAQSRMQFWLRVGIEAAAQAAKAAATVVLLLLRPAACTAGEALSAAQLLYGLAVSLGYAWAFRRELPGLAAAALSGPRACEETRRSAELSLGFSVQALEKLVLAEGSKFVMAALESSHNQGIYGMVSNLGSLFVRLVLQPLEESAFAAFASGAADVRRAAAGGRCEAAGQLAQALHGVLRATTLVGCVVAAFGPAYSYTALRLVYGRRWADSETAPALGAYSVFVALLAVNGVSEAFTHAAGDERQLRAANGALLAFGVAHMGLSFFLCKAAGTYGLIAADAVGMLMRIAYSIAFMRRFFRDVEEVDAWGWLPHPATIAALAGSAAAALTSERLTTATRRESGYGTAAATHVAVGVGLLSVVAAVAARYEGPQLRAALKLKRHSKRD